MNQTYLTGVKPTGTFHLGNYVSVIKPVVEGFLENPTGFLFLADVHALNTKPTPKDFKNSSEKMLATLLAFFKDKVETGELLIYRQSAIPETFEISHLLTQFMAMGLLNRCHAYKVKIQEGKECNLGLFLYPHLMAVDILQMNPDFVPIGPDQDQHLEIAKELARVTNNFLGKEFFKVPKGFIQTKEVLLGVDGTQKMSKSYNNVIPIFEDIKRLKKLIFSIPTNFKNVGEAKDFSESAVCSIYKALATEKEISLLKIAMQEGIGWGNIKQMLFDKVLEITENPKQIYEELLKNKEYIFELIKPSEEKAREKAAYVLTNLKRELGCLIQ